MQRPRSPSATIHHFSTQSATSLSPTTECARAAMGRALAGFEHQVSGTIERGRALLSGEVGSEAEEQLIVRSVLRLHCVTDVIDDIVVRPPKRATSAPQHRSWDSAEKVQPIIFRTSFCSLLEAPLANKVEDDLKVLIRELDGDGGPPADEAYVFYYGWHNDAALVDVAIPAAGALERRRTNDVRASIMPSGRHCVVPSGGITGLKSARRFLRLASGATISDQLFRVWQRVPLEKGRLPHDWLNAPLHSAL